MNRYRILCLAGLLIIIAAGCSNDNTDPIPVERLTLTLTLETDEVRTPMNGVAVVDGYAQIASDWRPKGIPGLPIEFAYQKPFTYLSYLDATRQAVTDADGKVRFRLRAYSVTKSEISVIYAYWGCLTATDTVSVAVPND